MKNKKQWYAVRCIFLHKDLDSEIKSGKVYEERITLWRANGFEAAIEKAEKEAKQYAGDENTEYLGFCDIYNLYDETIQNGSEVYSLMRDSALTPSKYIDKFFDTGKERIKEV